MSELFPSGFTWGSATSSYQIEGGVEKHGRGLSVWDAFSHTPGRVRMDHNGDVACDHVNRFREDVALMKEIGLEAYRFSVAWPRVMPEGAGAVSEPGLAFYDRLVDELLGAGIQPWVTLFHWDYPLTLARQGGWLNPSSPFWFEEYARAVVDRLSDRVSHWITINEPQVSINLGHSTGEHAPGLKLPLADLVLISHHMLVAHGQAARTIRERAKTKPQVTWAPVGVVRIPSTNKPEDIELARSLTFSSDREDMWLNSWYNDPVFLGHYPEDGLSRYGKMLPDGWERDLEVIAQPMDLFGVNIYHGSTVKPDGDGHIEVPLDPGHPRTAFGWPITPECLYWGPKFFYERYGKPVVITENGRSNHDVVSLDGRVHDPQRIDYTTRHLLEVSRAIKDGIPIRAYFHWSLLDNFEWAEGYEQRFGLVHVDFQTQKRTPKDSAYWYAGVIKSNGSTLANASDPLVYSGAGPTT